MELNSFVEEVLKSIQSQADDHSIILYDTLKNYYPPEKHRMLNNALEQLSENELVRLSKNYDGTINYIKLLSNGEFYFETKSVEVPQTINISNSSGIAIGNNNNVSITEGVSFDDAYELIEQLNVSNKELLNELVRTLQDCIETSKPLPKGKFKTFLETTKEVLPLCTLIGKIIFKSLGIG